MGLGLPIAGFSALADMLHSRDASDLAGKVSLLAVGVGFCLAAPARVDRFVGAVVRALGLFGLVLGTKLLLDSSGPMGAIAVAAPYVVAALCGLVMVARESTLAPKAR